MKEIAKLLCDIEALSIDPNFGFIWASGIESPVYCDNRLLLSFPEQRSLVYKYWLEHIQENYKDIEVLCGTATAGIPHAAILADHLNLPMIYVRSSAKDHGKKNLIEGKIKAGQKVLVIEDLISTGKSSKFVIDELLKVKADIAGLSAIFSYDFQKSKETLKSYKNSSLTNIHHVLDIYLEQKIISESDVEKIKNWVLANA